MRQLFIAVFLLTTIFSTFAQHFIKGKVTDEKGQELIGATIFIKSESLGKTTDKQGKFIFENLKRNIYVVEFSFVGFETQVLNLPVDRENLIQLQRKTFEISEITVSSIRANDRSAVAYTDLKKEDIANRNLGQDIPYLLALTPSFISTSDGGTGIGATGFRIRGTDANRTNVTVNGVPLNDAESHGTFFVNMPDFASSLSSIQVQRGVGTSTNGASAFGASINMETENFNPKPYAELSSTLGSFNTNKNTVKFGTGLLDNKFAFDARLSNITSDGYVDRAWVDMKSYFLSAGYYADKTTIKFQTFGGTQKTYQAWNGVNSDSLKTNSTYNELGEYVDNNGKTKYYDDQTDNYNQTHYQLHWSQEFSSKLHLNTSAHLTRGVGYYEDYKQGRKYLEYGLIPDTLNGAALKKTDLVRQKWLDNYFYGLTYTLNYSDKKFTTAVGGGLNRYIGDHYGKVIWVRNANNLDMSKDWYRNTSEKNDANIYAKANIELFKGFFASLDLQYRYISYSMEGFDDKYDSKKKTMIDLTTAKPYEYHFFNPKLGLTYKIDSTQDVYGSYSISNREPNRKNYTEAGKNDTPTYETLFDTEVGYRYLSKNLSAGVNLYYMRYNNQLILTGKVSEIGAALTSNIPDSYRAGIELSVGAKITNWIRWNGNLALSQNKIKNFIEYDVEAFDASWGELQAVNDTIGTTNIAYSPNIVTNSMFTFNFNQFEVGIHSNYVGKQYFDNTSNEDRSINDYFVNNLSVKYSWTPKYLKAVDFQVLVNNVFDHQYETNAYTWYSYYLDGTRVNGKRYFPQAGINFLASVTIKF